MNLEKKLKQHINQKLDKEVPNPYKKKRFPVWAKIMIPVTAVTVAVAVPIIVMNATNLENIIGGLTGTYVDMEGVAGFGIGNMPTTTNGKAKMKTMHYLKNTDKNEEEEEKEQSSSSSEYTSDTSWTDEQRELYDWESDYDWDPSKANVLFSLDEDGKVEEVIYERTNGRGQVRQDHIGNAAAMFVSKNFTYVMYVNDSEWDFYKEIDYAQELRNPSGFHVHHEMRQTIVIHHETGKVFALKDLISQVNEITGAINYTMQADPTKDDFLHVHPMYGEERPLWFKVTYDEELEKVIYTNVLPEGSKYRRSNNAKEDIYGQLYVLADDEGYDQTVRLTRPEQMVNLIDYEIYENTLITRTTNSVFFGNDYRAYAFINGKLNVFGENFELSPIEKETKVNFEGLANEFFDGGSWLNGSCFHFEEGYLFSAFGDVWEVDNDGLLIKLDNLTGDFVKYTNDAFMVGGQIIAFVGTKEFLWYSVDGYLVQLFFFVKDGVPSYEAKYITYMSEYSSYGHRIIILHDELGGLGRGYTEYFLLTVKDGEAQAQYVAYGDNGGMIGVAGAISEPIDLTV